MVVTKSATRPGKPYKEFPLFPHPNGQWAKKIQGKPWYFGKWENPDAALQRYLDEINDIQAGRDPRRTGIELVSDTISVVDMLNMYLTSMDRKQAAGEISARHFGDCKRSCKVVADHFGRNVRVPALRATDFSALRKAFPSTWGATKVGMEIQRMRTAFRWAAESELIPALPNFGPDFRKPPKRVIRIEKQERQAKHGTLDFTAPELRTLVDSSNGWMTACILPGVNSGFGASDCGRLRVNNIDMATGWYDLARRKTGIPRRCWMWPETRAAIHDAMMQRPLAVNDDDEALCFLTSHGKPVWWESAAGNKCDNVGNARNAKVFYVRALKPPK